MPSSPSRKRLSEALQDVPKGKGKMVEVHSDDVVAVCDEVENATPVVEALRAGSDAAPNTLVTVQADDLVHVLAQKHKPGEPGPTPPPVG